MSEPAKNIQPQPAASKPPAPATNVWDALRGEMNELFDRFTGGVSLFPSRIAGKSDWYPDLSFNWSAPAADLTEDDKEFRLTAELPGLSEKDIDLSISGDLLTLKGEKKEEKEQKEKNYYLSERSYGSFQRSFTLPQSVDRAKIAANFEKGVLTVTLPKSAEAKNGQKKIAISAK